MKSIRLKLLVAGLLLSSTVLNAEILFDLQAQHFSKALEGNFEGARYDLPQSFVSTNLKYEDGKYTTKDNGGYFKVEIKEPKSDWSVSLDVWYYMYYASRGRSIKLISNNGQSIDVFFSYKNITFDGKKVVSNLYDYERISVGFIQDGDNIELYINGAKVGTAVRSAFGELKFVEAQLVNNTGSTMDDLIGLTIGSK